MTQGLEAVSPQPRSWNRNHWVFAIQVVGTIAVIAWIIGQIDFRPLIDRFTSIRWGGILLLLALGVGDRVLNAWKWHILMVAKGIPLNFAEAFRIQMIATFFANLLPTAVGFDAARVYLASKSTSRVVDSMSAATVDRILTVVLTFLAASIAVATNAQVGNLTYWSIVLPLLVIMAGLVFAARSRWIRRLGDVAARVVGQRVALFGAKFYRSVHDFANHRRAVVAACGVTAASLMVRVVFTYVAAAALTLEVSFGGLLRSLPLTWVALMLPISIGGLGLQEAAYLIALTTIGIDATSAVAISLLDQILTRVVSLLGAVFWLGGPRWPLRSI
jgi:uncharacterized protein (TIRG00374 family)